LAIREADNRSTTKVHKFEADELASEQDFLSYAPFGIPLRTGSQVGQLALEPGDIRCHKSCRLRPRAASWDSDTGVTAGMKPQDVSAGPCVSVEPDRQAPSPNEYAELGDLLQLLIA